jgi:replicative DNA helicase
MNSLPIKDDNDRLLEGTLPQDPFSDAELLDPAAPDTATNEDQNWPDPLPISPVSNVPVFPVDTLPPWLRDWVTALATALQCPVDLPAMLGLAVLALCAAKRYQAHVIQGWDEPLNLYVAVALKPGESKSPAFAAAIRPVSRFVTEEHRRTDPEIRAAIARADVAAKRTDHLKTRAAKATAPEEYAKSLALVEEAVLEHASIDVPVPLRLVLDDVTAESLEAVLRHQGGRIALMSDEGGPFELMGGRYSNGIPNIDVYLKGHSGNQITTDRIGREGGSIQEPAITIGLAIQPDIIASLRDKKGFRGRGLLARFLWAIPESLVGRRAPDAPPVPLEVSQAYEDAVTSLLRRPTRRDETGEIKSRPMDFSAAAYELVVGLKAKNEPKLGLAGEFEDVADWGNKLAGETVRIAGLLQLADHALEPDASAPLGVGTDPMRRALRITEYLVTHAQIAFDMMGADPVAGLARYLLAWILRNDVTSFTRREAYMPLRARFKQPAELDLPLDLLSDHEIIRRRPDPPRSGPGRPPSPTFDVNPKIHAQNAQKSQNSESGPPAGNSVNSVYGFGADVLASASHREDHENA